MRTNGTTLGDWLTISNNFLMDNLFAVHPNTIKVFPHLPFYNFSHRKPWGRTVHFLFVGTHAPRESKWELLSHFWNPTVKWPPTFRLQPLQSLKLNRIAPKTSSITNLEQFTELSRHIHWLMEFIRSTDMQFEMVWMSALTIFTSETPFIACLTGLNLWKQIGLRVCTVL